MKTFIKILILLFCVSCSREVETSEISLSLVFPSSFETLEQLKKSREVVPETLDLITNKGIFTFELNLVSGGAVTNKVSFEKGDYQIIDVKLYDANGNLTHEVYQGVPKAGTLVATWVDGYYYDFNRDNQYVFQVWNVF